jgi:hypothetical protein
MTQTQLLRVIRLLMMFSVLVVLLLGRGYQLEMDTRSGQMRRIETLLGMRVWRGSAEESLYSAEIHPDKRISAGGGWRRRLAHGDNAVSLRV